MWIDGAGAAGLLSWLEPHQHRYGTAATFEAARKGFEADWNALVPLIPDGAFNEYRRHRAVHAWMETMWAAGLPLPTQVASGRMLLRYRDRYGSVDLHIDAEHMT